MCHVMGVRRNGFYRFVKQQKRSSDDKRHREMLEWVKDIGESSDFTYGSRRMRAALEALGYPVCRETAAKLMKEAGITVRHRKKYKVTTNSNHKQPVYENVLKREFDVKEPDQVYASDITYIWTQEGWLYLAVVIDLFSRKVVGWSMGTRMQAKLVCDALSMAVGQRHPKPGLIHHSDRGSQYASQAFASLLQRNGFVGSMSRKGDCWDNAVVESFFGSLKQERVQWRNYQTRYEAQQNILNYITMFYNAWRLHSHLGYKSPSDYEKEKAETESEMRKAA